MERRDSKRNSTKQRQKDKGGKSKSEDGDEERKGKLNGGLVRTKPCREIYRPPSMRKGRTNSTGSTHDLPSPPPFNNHNNNRDISSGNAHASSYGQNHPISPIARPTVSSSNNSQNNSSSQNTSRTFNVHAKEFQFQQQQQQQQPQSLNYNQASPFFPNGNGPSNLSNADYFGQINKNSPILASSGCYPLTQSKSSGNVNSANNFYQLWNQQQGHPTADQALNLSNSKQQVQRVQVQGFDGPKPISPEVNDGLYSYRLQQSKSSGSISMNLRQQQQQCGDSVLKNPMRNNNNNNNNPNNKTVRFDFPQGNGKTEEISPLIQGSGPNPDRFSKIKREMDFPEQSFASLQIDDGTMAMPKPLVGSGAGVVASSPQIMSKFRHPQQVPSQQLQKSRTTFMFPQNNSSLITNGGRNTVGCPTYLGEVESLAKDSQRLNPLIRRSRSFGVAPRSNNTNPSSMNNHGANSSLSSNFNSNHYTFSSPEFDLTSWPKAVQDSVNSALMSADRVPARARIEMVARIFHCILDEKSDSASGANTGKNHSQQKRTGSESSPRADDSRKENKDDNADKNSDGNNSDNNKNENDCEGNKKEEKAQAETEQKNSKEDSPKTEAPIQNSPQSNKSEAKQQNSSTDLITSAVNIFLYFIQREKDRTVVESVLNTCFDTFQRIQRASTGANATIVNGSNSSNEHLRGESDVFGISHKWIAFLQFLSTMYSNVKVLRLQKAQSPGLRAIDELNYSLLVLLCDSCLVTLRSPVFQTAKTMDSLFQIMTSIGRDMENTFPMKMKQILASVRDALLGIKPYSMDSEGPPANVQKTLMQLIELHAANWSLPYNALKYYYNF